MLHALSIYSLAIVSGYTWIETNPSQILDKVKKISGLLSLKHKSILKRNFPFYSKLSPSLLKHFEQKVEYYFYKKKFIDSLGKPADDKKKLLIAAYAAQLTFGLKDFYFLHLKKIIVHEEKFYSNISKKFVSWEISEDGVIAIAWKIFYSELRNVDNTSPLGLMVMANALKLEKYSFLKEQIYYKHASTYFTNSKVGKITENWQIFEEKDMKNNEDFFIACLIHYFSKPMDLKNRYPDLFKKIDYTMFNKVS